MVEDNEMDRDGNILDALPGGAHTEEIVNALLATPDVRIERIVSTGQASPPDFWYDQDWNEWVILLSGGAQLLFEDEGRARSLVSGNYVYIAAHRRHRVAWTDPQQVTIWLAVHFR